MWLYKFVLLDVVAWSLCHPYHTLEDGCRCVDGGLEVARRVGKQLGEQAKVGPCRDPAIPAAGVVDGDPIIDDIDLGADVGAHEEGRVVT